MLFKMLGLRTWVMEVKQVVYEKKLVVQSFSNREYV